MERSFDHVRKRSRVEDEDDEEMDIIMVIICFVVAVLSILYANNDIPRQLPEDLDHTRRSYLNRLYRGTEVNCLEQLQVSKQCFRKLCKVLRERGGLTRTRNVSIEEAVAMFLHILGHNTKYRVIHMDFCRSKETISRQFNSVMCAVMRVSKEYLKSHECILNDSDAAKWKWFENCLGALDGSHIPVSVSAESRPRYRNRKGVLSTNMLGVCAPDLKIIYALPGWEGSASDSRVLRDALCRRYPLHIPNDKYYLVDAGYANGPGFLAPYRGTRYHLNEWRGNTPSNYKELFNLRHSAARNAIERCFGLLKKRWSILRTPSFFDIKTHIRIISACCVLHNFILMEKHCDPILEAQDSEFLDSIDQELFSQLAVQRNTSTENEITSVRVSQQWTTFRDTLAKNMFDDYQARHG